ncbi:ABC transporter permease [Burkholderia ambifaria]|uniref:ABC transporter permease n=1 Tax=Burkholderia ambifaria TaxID=152480 RepID=UPI001B94BD67|nr:ABC transporter permease [Burkholderia ambifaria]MBR8183420.1 ABC transporter permease [Burkholderia ambifaria]
MRDLHKIGIGSAEALLLAVIAAMAIGIGVSTPAFATLPNLCDLLNQSSVNLIFAVGLLVVLIAGGIDISFAVGASVVQYLTALTMFRLGGGNWALGVAVAAGFGCLLGAVNATIIYRFRVVSIVATIATFNVFFGGLMFATGGVSIYDLPDWWTDRISLVHVDTPSGGADLALPVAAMLVAVGATWFLLRRTTLGRQLYAAGDNPEAARRIGIRLGTMHYVAYGWLGTMAGIAGLMQAHYVQEVVPNAFYGRELDVLAAVVLGGARLGGGRGAVLGIVLVSIAANGLNLLGVSPYAFKMIVGAVILIAIVLSSDRVARLIGSRFSSSNARAQS